MGHLRVRDPYLQTPQNIPCQEKTNIGESICSDPSYANHVDDGYVTRYHDPVVAIKPLNSKSIVPQIKRPVKFEGQTNLYRTSARVYGSLVPRTDEVGPALRQTTDPMTLSASIASSRGTWASWASIDHIAIIHSVPHSTPHSMYHEQTQLGIMLYSTVLAITSIYRRVASIIRRDPKSISTKRALILNKSHIHL